MAEVTADQVRTLFDPSKTGRNPRIVEWMLRPKRPIGVIWDGVQAGEPGASDKEAYAQIAVREQVVGMLRKAPTTDEDFQAAAEGINRGDHTYAHTKVQPTQ